MARGKTISVRTGTVRCRGPARAPHEDIVLRVPFGKKVTCPVCGQAFRRVTLHATLSNANWPQRN